MSCNGVEKIKKATESKQNAFQMLPGVHFKFSKEYFRCSSALFNVCYWQCQKSCAAVEKERYDSPPLLSQNRSLNWKNNGKQNNMKSHACVLANWLSHKRYFIQLKGSHVRGAMYHFSGMNEILYFDLSQCWAILMLYNILIMCFVRSVVFFLSYSLFLVQSESPVFLFVKTVSKLSR